MPTFELIGDCWRCDKIRSRPVDTWHCVVGSRWIGEPNIDKENQCPDFVGEAGTDKEEFNLTEKEM